jgi:hypothetical protein
MPDGNPDVDQPETDTPIEDESGEPRLPTRDADAWGKPQTGTGGAPDEEAAGWKGATEANRDDD